MAQIIDGKKIAQLTRAQVAQGVEAFKLEKGILPGLATILVGDDPASQVYIRNKNKFCKEAGMESFHYQLPSSTSEKELLELVERLNRDTKVHGILCQLPLPRQINSDKIIAAIDPSKDVDGFHPVNVGNLVVGRPGFKPCTPFGVMKLLEAISFDVSGKDAVVIGRSNIVGKPMALLLLGAGATVTVCHSKTKDVPKAVSEADLVVAAVGVAELVKGQWIKEGAVVIDVGINRTSAGNLVGDVEFESAQKRASYITPVPGGVGPMTIAMLLWNTLEAARNSCLPMALK